MRVRRRRGSTTSAADLEGLHAGLNHRLASAPRGKSRDEASALAEKGRGALERGEWVEAREALLAAHERLDAEEPESELREFPRGLVGYVPRGDRGVPVGPEEDSVANRLRLALRLAAVVRRDGIDTERIDERLRAAEAFYRTGDRAGAVRATDDALGWLERARPPRTASAGARGPRDRREP
ncbi:MAG: hypothetical protein L3K23_05815 [Thermoplasmata archaeon]|nr:hypothetical protein [Thermoplasmata archaeon]